VCTECVKSGHFWVFSDVFGLHVAVCEKWFFENTHFLHVSIFTFTTLTSIPREIGKNRRFLKNSVLLRESRVVKQIVFLCFCCFHSEHTFVTFVSNDAGAPLLGGVPRDFVIFTNSGWKRFYCGILVISRVFLRCANCVHDRVQTPANLIRGCKKNTCRPHGTPLTPFPEVTCTRSCTDAGRFFPAPEKTVMSPARSPLCVPFGGGTHVVDTFW
jgi:hypothetical protein